ncbi:MAG: SDR family oxidoreductase [Phycisphaerales bacterium JB060]
MDDHPARQDQPFVLLTGATGYIGGRLAPRLIEAGYRIRCLARSPRKLDNREWARHERAEIVQGDVEDANALAEHMRGCRYAYYLVHSMISAGGQYADRDRELARSFRKAAEQAGVKRIIYLGGLGEMGEDLSDHLRSRREVERVLAEGAVPVTVLRAAMIIGSGSASFEILRYLVERLPIMVTPKWVSTRCQPVAIADILHWLIRCLEEPKTAGGTYEVGGDGVRTYNQLMRVMARELGLPRRLVIPVPVLTPELSSRWIGLVTPVSASIGRPLAEGLRNPVVVRENDVREAMPHQPKTPEEAIALALERTSLAQVETSWSSAGVVEGDPDWAGGRVFTDARQREIDASPEAVFRAVGRVGGGHGWYASDMLWRLRGWMDNIAGGPGLRRGRRHPEEVAYGEALDFWRVIAVERPNRLHLLAEMRLPGQATLEFGIEPLDDGERSRLCMTARFKPRGLMGLAYWYTVLPAHHVVFNGMLRGMQRAAERFERG